MPELPRVLIHVGRPDAELPHKSFIRVEKLFEKYPTVFFVCICWTKEDVEAVNKAVSEVKKPEGHPGYEVILWDSDSKLMDYLCANLHKYIGAKIVAPGWYTCENKHITERQMDKPLEKCLTCNGVVIYTTEFMEQFTNFAQVFSKVTNLINFDTRSGECLNAMVNPTENVMRNMRYALPLDPVAARAIDMDSLVGSEKGKTAYLVAAGPSLEDNLQDLKRLQDTGVIICVGRVYKLLKENGIRVDYVMSCEMFDWDSVIFDNVGDVGETVLCYPAVCAPATVEKWPGKRVCLWDINSAEILRRKKWMMGGNSVAHHVLNFAAEILDCEPLIFVGQDLAYTKPRAHAKGTDHEFPDGIKQHDQAFHSLERWYPSNGKCKDFPDDCFRVEGWGVKIPLGPVQVKTSQAYLDFLSLFEILLTRHKKKAWNTSGGGVKIEGAPYLDLSTYLVSESTPGTAPLPILPYAAS